jgi:prepilin-type N-terminal cleavage/methylation domain-containing protein/prepilin-type processing-associated H-X9-DG protein
MVIMLNAFSASDESKEHRLHFSGFTLIELLIVITILGTLAGLIFGSVGTSMQRGKRINCISNLKQIITAAHLYAGDNYGRYSDARTLDSRDLNYLSAYVNHSPRIFICPATQNKVSNVRDDKGRFNDLKQMASSRIGSGSSYLLCAFMGWKTPYFTDFSGPNGEERVYSVLKTESSVSSYVHYHSEFNLSGIVPGPAGIFLLTDNTWNGVQDWPDPEDNHGKAGANAVFLDGHADWVSRNKYVFTYELSQDDGRRSIEPNR